MKIFVAGATGAIGRQLVPRLVARGHDVAGTTRTPAKFDLLRRQGATPFLVDGLDAEQVATAVASFQPEVIVHELTDLGYVDMRDFAASFAMTNRLRTEGTDHLLAAGRAVGVRRFVAQSFAGWPFARTGAAVKREDEPLDPNPVPAMRETLAAIRHVERATLEADWTEGVVLRYAGLYGPGTGMEPGGEMLEALRARKLPIIGNGAGIWSFVHIEDAAEATGSPRSAARAASTRSPTMSQLQSPSGSRSSRGDSAPSRRCCSALARAAARRRSGRGRDDGGPWGLEREGQARARLDAAAQLANEPRGRGDASRRSIEGRVIDDTALLEELRPYAFSIAYRMLGSVAEAEDVVQEALLRVHGAVEAGTRFELPRAYVATVTTRLALDQLKSARVRRETYVGEWLPEPIVTDEGADPERHAEVADMVSYAFLALLERLSPEQRAVLLLRDVFEYEYPEIASIVGTSPENARQLASRARRNVTEGRPRFEASREDHRALVGGFLAAVDRGDVQTLERMLAKDVVLHGDGGGKVPAVMRALEGRDHAIRTLAAWWRAGMAGRAVARVVEVNGEPDRASNAAGELLGVIAIEVRDGLIVAIRSVVNPDKLQHLGPVGDMHALLARDA